MTLKPRPVSKSEARTQNSKGAKGGKIPKGNRAAPTGTSGARVKGS